MRTVGRVLVIDDDSEYLATVRAVLSEAGYAADAALSVGGALDLLWREWDAQPDVILLDLHLPLLDGRTFAELYAVLPVRHAPLVLVTGVDEREAREYAHLVSAVGLLHKPFDLEELLACVERARSQGSAHHAGDVGDVGGGAVTVSPEEPAAGTPVARDDHSIDHPVEPAA